LHLKEKHKKLGKKFFLTLAIVWTIIIVTLSLLSAAKMSSIKMIDIVGIDKVGHIIFYTLLSYLWLHVFQENKRSIVLIIFLCITFGFFIEILQFYLSNGRSFELADIGANGTGVFLGYILFNKFKIKEHV